jgi:hypothetical protein
MFDRGQRTSRSFISALESHELATRRGTMSDKVSQRSLIMSIDPSPVQRHRRHDAPVRIPMLSSRNLDEIAGSRDRENSGRFDPNEVAAVDFPAADFQSQP